MRIRLVELPVPSLADGFPDPFLEAASTRPVADLTILPELYANGYDLGRIPALAVAEDDLAGLPASGWASGRACWLAAGTWPVRTADGRLLNRLAVFSPDGRLASTTDKTHLFGDMGEDRVFSPGLPSGVFDVAGHGAGAFICYDVRFPEMARRLALAGAEILIVPAQWPESRGDLFRCLLRARSAEAQVFTAGCNIGGEHLGVRFGGGGGVAHPSGSLLEGEDVAEGVRDYRIDFDDISMTRKRIDCLRDLRPGVY